MTEHEGTNTDGEHRADDHETGDGDPLLVRPWMGGGGSAETWPRPARHAAAHRAVPSPIALPGRPQQKAPDRRRFMIVASAGAAAVLALGAAGFAALSSDDDPDAGLPRAIGAASPSGTTGPQTSVSPASPSAAQSTGPSAIRQPGGGDDGRPARTTAGPTGSTASASPAPRRTSSQAALAPGAKPADRTGVIGGPGSLCLDLNGAVASDGNFIQVYTCNGTNAQTWTLGADGTLRVIGKCAQSIAGDNTVHIIGCPGQSSARWRVGTNNSLVNAATGRCLTDPANGGTSGTAVRLNACTGDATQRWKLP